VWAVPARGRKTPRIRLQSGQMRKNSRRLFFILFQGADIGSAPLFYFAAQKGEGRLSGGGRAFPEEKTDQDENGDHSQSHPKHLPFGGLVFFISSKHAAGSFRIGICCAVFLRRLKTGPPPASVRPTGIKPRRLPRPAAYTRKKQLEDPLLL
jgi:hypothetical protein